MNLLTVAACGPHRPSRAGVGGGEEIARSSEGPSHRATAGGGGRRQRRRGAAATARHLGMVRVHGMSQVEAPSRALAVGRGIAFGRPAVIPDRCGGALDLAADSDCGAWDVIRIVKRNWGDRLDSDYFRSHARIGAGIC